jgi:NADH:ubiquinone oxidoreductase subunit K
VKIKSAKNKTGLPPLTARKMVYAVIKASIFLAVSGGRPVLFLALLIFTVIAAEGRIGLAFLLKARRQCSPRIEKRGV